MAMRCPEFCFCKYGNPMLTFCVSVNFPTFIGNFSLPYIDWGISVSHGGHNHQAFVKFCINNSQTPVIADPTLMETSWIFYSATTSMSTVYYLIMLALPCAVLVIILQFIFV